MSARLLRLPSVVAVLAALLAPAGRGQRVGAEEMLPVARGEDPVVLTVGDESIRASDAYRELDLVVPARAAEIVRQMMLSAVGRRLSLEHGIDVPAAQLAEEVDAALAEQRARFALEADGAMSLEEFMAARFGFTPERHRAEIRTRVLAALLLDRVVRFELAREERDQLQVILVEDGDLAREIVDKLQQGASFAMLARKHSVHPTGPAGGDLPDVPTGARVPLLEGREGMAPGDVLGPAPITLDGKDYLRIVRMVDRVAADLRPWSERRELVERGLAQRPLQAEELSLFEARMMDRYRVTRPDR